MRSYIFRRLLLIIPTVFIASLIVFIVIRSIPGSVVDTIVSSYEYITHDDIAAVRAELGLDKPVLTQYFHWVDQIVIHGNLGTSMLKKTPVIDDIKARWPVTFELGIMGIIFAITDLLAYRYLFRNTAGYHRRLFCAQFCNIMHRCARLLAGDDGDCLPLNMVGLYAADNADQV